MVSLQRDQTFLGLYEELRNGYCQILKEQSSTTVAGVYEYVLLGICQLDDNMVLKLPGGEPTLKFNATINTAELANVCTSITDAAVSGTSLGTQTVTANAYYKMFTI
jgi:hypothetical protein